MYWTACVHDCTGVTAWHGLAVGWRHFFDRLG